MVAEKFARHIAGLAEASNKPLILVCEELARDSGFGQEDLIQLAELLGAFIVTPGNGHGACLKTTSGVWVGGLWR